MTRVDLSHGRYEVVVTPKQDVVLRDRQESISQDTPVKEVTPLLAAMVEEIEALREDLRRAKDELRDIRSAEREISDMRAEIEEVIYKLESI